MATQAELEQRIADLERRIADLQAEASSGGVFALMDQFFPPETRRHMRAAQKEQLLAFRSLLDKWIARDPVHASVQPDERVERLDEIRVAVFIVGERAERAFRLGLDVRLGLTEHEAIRAEVLEVRRLPGAAVAALERDGLFGLEQ